MGKKKNKNQAQQPLPPPPVPAQQSTQQPWRGAVTANPTASARMPQNQPVDSWRSYSNDTTNLQTATDMLHSNPFQPRHAGTGQEQGSSTFSSGLNASAWAPQQQQVYGQPILGQPATSAAPQAMSPDALPFRPSPAADISRFKPYQPLRVSDGTKERQAIEQASATNQTHLQTQVQSQPQASQSRYKLRQRPEVVHSPLPPTRRDRYPLRERSAEQISPFSTGAAARIEQSIERPDPAFWSDSIPRAGISQRGWTPEPKAIPRPIPTKQYMQSAELDPVRLHNPARLLVILDLNGTLLVRPNKRDPKRIVVRPGVPAFLDYLFRNHVVMVYSSARPQNCAAMIEKFFRPDQRSVLVAVWARDKLGLTPAQYDAKTQVYKKLEPVWDDDYIQSRAWAGRKWDQRNTVLVDDSKLKAAAQPHNLLQITEFLNNEPLGIQAKLNWHRGEEAIVQSVQQKLEELKWQVDVSRLIRQWQIGKQQAPGVIDETIDHKALQHPDGRIASLTPTPSISDRAPSEPRQQNITKGHASQPMDIDKAEDGVSSGADDGVTVDDLEKEINRNFSLNTTTRTEEDQERHLDQSQLKTAGAVSAAGSGATAREVRIQQPRSESSALRATRTDPPRGEGAGYQRHSTRTAADAEQKSRQEGKKETETGAGRDREGSIGHLKTEKSPKVDGAPITPESM